MRTIVCAAMLVLTACAQIQVSSVGNDTHELSFTPELGDGGNPSANEPRLAAKANELCAGRPFRRLSEKHTQIGLKTAIAWTIQCVN